MDRASTKKTKNLPDKIFGRSYSGLIQLPTMAERFEYLKLGGVIGDRTFGGDRYLNQNLYTSSEWRSFRERVIIRDNGCDMAMAGYEIQPAIEGRSLRGRKDYIIIHHINPLTVEDIRNGSKAVFDMDNVVCVSTATHRAIHYGDASMLPKEPIIRRPNDTCPWKK